MKNSELEITPEFKTLLDDRNSVFSRVLALIPDGAENAVPMSSLAASLKLSERDARAAILKLCLNGFVIAGDENGYFIPSDDSELLSYYRLYRSRALTSLTRIKAARRLLKQHGVNPDA